MREKKEYVLLLDEVDEVAKQDSESGNMLFGALAGAPKFGVIIAGHLKLRKAIQNTQSQLYNIVEKLDVAGLDKPSGRSLIVDPILGIGLRLKDGSEMVNYILEQSACRPVIIQLYCRELVNRTRHLDLDKIGIEDVKQVEQTRAFREDMLDAFLIGMPSLSRLIVLFMLENNTFTEESLHVDTKSDYLRSVLGTIATGSGVGQTRRQRIIADILRSEIQRIVRQSEKRLILLIDHIDAVSDDVARDLLSTLRALYDDTLKQARKLGVATAGAVNLLYLTTGTLSPFNIAERYLLGPLTFDEAMGMLNGIATEKNVSLNDSESKVITELTNCEPCLIEKFVQNIPFVQTITDSVVSEGKQLSIPYLAFERLIKIWENDNLLKSTVDGIEDNNAWLRLVAELITGHDAVFMGVDTKEYQPPDMCLALTRKENCKYEFANPFWKRLLETHFTPIRLADSYVLIGRWNEAKKWYQEASRSREKFTMDSYTLDDLVVSAFGTLDTTKGITEIQHETVEIVYHILGVD
jgi:hypothetical protein